MVGLGRGGGGGCRDTEFSSGCGWNRLLEISGDVRLASLSSRMEVWIGGSEGKLCLCLLSRSMVLSMCIRQLFQASHLQGAWRAAFLKHIQCRRQGARRWTHSGGGTYRAVIFDMGGVLIPSPGRVAAGELFLLFQLQRLRWGRGNGDKGRQRNIGPQCIPVGDILALESNARHHLVAEYLGQIIQLL